MEFRILTKELRQELKAPLGMLIRGSFRQTTERLADLIDKTRPRKLITVGDRISRNAVERGLFPDVLIVDNKVMRRPIPPTEFKAEKSLRLVNPAGTLTEEAWQVVEEAVAYKGRAKILVEGEEDLITLVAVLSAPNDSLVVYGQPKEGIVVIRVNEDTKRKVRGIVDRMENRASKD